jgi:hypothetical protein
MALAMFKSAVANHKRSMVDNTIAVIEVFLLFDLIFPNTFTLRVSSCICLLPYYSLL